MTAEYLQAISEKNSGLFTPEGLQLAARHYAEAAVKFLRNNGLAHFVSPPVDHFAVKARDTQDFGLYLERVDPFCRTIVIKDVGDGRHIATARLDRLVDFGVFGKTCWLEIMEPKPGRVVVPGLDHIEVYRTDLDVVDEMVRACGITPKPHVNPSHGAVVLPLWEGGPEIKFTNGLLVEITRDDLLRGGAYTLK